MNQQIQELVEQAGGSIGTGLEFAVVFGELEDFEKFVESIVEAVLDQVKERAYYTGDRDWSDEVDRPWIQLEFGYGALAK